MLKKLGNLKTTETKKSVHVRIDVTGSPLEFPGAHVCNSCARSNACVVIWLATSSYPKFGGDEGVLHFCRGLPKYWKGEGEAYEEIDCSEGNCDQIRWCEDD